MGPSATQGEAKRTRSAHSLLILEKVQWDLTNVNKYLMDGSKDRARLRGVLLQDKRQWTQTEMQKIPLKCKKKGFITTKSNRGICCPDKLWAIHPALTRIVAKETAFFLLQKNGSCFV